MNMDRKAFGAIAACAAFYLVYSFYLSNKYPNAGKPVAPQAEQSSQVVGQKDGASTTAQTATTTASATASDESTSKNAPESATASAPAASEKPLVLLDEKDLSISTDKVAYILDNKTSGFKKIELPSYKKSLNDGPINLAEAPVLLQAGLLDEAPAVDVYSSKRNGRVITFTRQVQNWQIDQSYTIPENGFDVSVESTWTNLATETRPLIASLQFRDSPQPPKKTGSWIPGAPSERPQIVVGFPKDQEHHDAEAFCEDDDTNILKSEAGVELTVVGFDRHYFASSLLLGNERLGYNVKKNVLTNGQCDYTIQVAKDFGNIEAGGVRTFKSKLWYGPKDTHITDAYSKDLRKMFNFGFFGMLTDPLLKGIELFYRVFGNWGLAIILMTFLLKMLFYPLTKKAAVAMHAQKKWQPEMNKLREKYKEDPRKQQQELMAFMSLHKINPMKGCLPILPQIPVFFAFYTVLSTAIELRQAPFVGWIQDLTVHDPYFIFPILWGATMVVQQKITPTPGLDQTQARIMMIMPIVFTAMMLTLPAGMILYMLTNTVISIAQQQYLNRRLENA